MGRGFRVTFSVPELQTALNQISAYDGRAAGKIEDAVSRSTKNIGKGAKQRVPVRTGALRKTISTRFDKNTITGYVKAGRYLGAHGGAPYAHLVEFGARPHKIKPKNKKALFFKGGFVGSVDHPGTAARPFMRPAFEDEKPNLIREISKAVKK